MRVHDQTHKQTFSSDHKEEVYAVNHTIFSAFIVQLLYNIEVSISGLVNHGNILNKWQFKDRKFFMKFLPTHFLLLQIQHP